MNPDPYLQAAYNAGYDRARRELASKQAKSRAAQPRRRDTKKGHRR